jgi:hypothetical protein
VDALKVRELMGHASITTTQRYFATTTEAVGEAMRKAMGWKREGLACQPKLTEASGRLEGSDSGPPSRRCGLMPSSRRYGGQPSRVHGLAQP